MAPSYETEIKGQKVRIQAGSAAAEYRYRIALNPERNRVITCLVREALRRNHRVIVLVEQKPHLALLSEKLSDIKHEALSGAVRPSARIAAMEQMDRGELPLILATKVFAKGVDVKTVSVIIDATGLPSEDNALQRYGRGVRKSDQKAGLIHIDISDRNNRYTSAAQIRLSALKQTGSPIVIFRWNLNPSAILRRCEALL